MGKITLFLMSEKGYRSLVTFLDNFDSKLIDFVVYARDKNVITDYAEQINSLAGTHKIKVYQRTDNYVISSKYIIAISWRWLIDITKERTLIVIHDSLLPKYRGFAPLVSQLINKEPYIGVTAVIANAEYDKGDIITQQKIEVSYPIKVKNAISKICDLYESILKYLVQEINENDSLKTVPQNAQKATYSLWRDEADYKINWELSASEIKNFIYSIGFPYKGATTNIQDCKIRIYDAQEIEDVTIMNRDVGKIIFMDKGFPVVVCGRGLLKITEAVYDKNLTSIFPLKNFRIRLA
ncbi:methionyl-tRNA formyltransferase [Hyunsoonleella aestuarii]|uniref:Methionyl-tRNA formyltransferase n=1 Tax=Hyunsoonleella aestuarii TaxID=912802 RepID=A0ABP8E6Y1_9FLAO|nr:formyltransferase family protein [Hyunsoonleella aestuarii]